MSDRVGMFKVMDVVEVMREEGESLLDTAHRVLIDEAMWQAGGVQKQAAELLGISPRVMHYHLHKGEASQDD